MEITKPQFLLSSLLLSLSLLQGGVAYTYTAFNNASATPGGQRYEREIGDAYVLETMPKIAAFVWKVFKQKSADQKRHYPAADDEIKLIVQDLHDGALGETGENGVYMSASGIEGYGGGDPKVMFTSILYHEMTHIFQWAGEGTAPGGLTEGMADYVVMKSPYFFEGYSTPGQGSKWDEGYGTTARFLEYCDSLRRGFTPRLNKMMRKVYKAEYWEILLGKSVDQLWREYKDKYGNIPAASAWSYDVVY